MKNIYAKYLIVSIFLVGVFLVSVAAFGQLAEGEKDTIFINQIKIQPSVQQSAAQKGKDLELKRLAQSLESQFISSVNATRVFKMVDRKRIADLQLEQEFAEVYVKAGDKNAAKLFQMTGAKFTFLPEIDGFEDRNYTDDYAAIGRTSLTRKLYISAVVQVVDTTTGELLPDSPSVQMEKVETVENAKFGQAEGSDQLIVELAKDMASKLSQEVVSLLRPAKILTVTGKQIMINRGSEGGFVPGVQVEIYAIENIVDEDTGEVFRNEMPVGKAEVVRGDKKQSFAMIGDEDFGIAKGCIVKPLKSPASSQAVKPATWSGGQESSGDAVAPRAANPETPGSSGEPLTW